MAAPPSKADVVTQIRLLVQEVGPASLTLKILKQRLSPRFEGFDFADEPNLTSWVKEVMAEAATQQLCAESYTARTASPTGGAGAAKKGKGKSASAKKRGRNDDEDAEADAGRAKKKGRAEGEPKKAQNAYMFFMADKGTAVREAYKAAHDGKIDIGACAKQLGEQWKAMSDEDKAPYNAQAAADKVRFEEEMDAFEDGGGVRGGRRPNKKDRVGKKAPKAKKQGPKRGQNAYMFFMADKGQAVRDAYKAAHDGKIDVAACAKEMGEKWKAMSDEEKAPYVAQAAADKARYAKEMTAKAGGGAAAGPAGQLEDDDDDDDDDDAASSSDSSDDDE